MSLMTDIRETAARFIRHLPKKDREDWKKLSVSTIIPFSCVLVMALMSSSLASTIIPKEEDAGVLSLKLKRKESAASAHK